VNLDPAWLVASLLVGSLGVGLLAYGKRQLRMPQVLAGLLLLGASTLAPTVLWMLAGTGVVLASLYGAVRAGL